MFLPSNITLKPGDSGDFVAELQRRLAAVDCFNHDMINGFYDGVTTNAVIAFQSRNGIRSDGIAGPETLRRLNGVISGDTTSGGGDTKQEEEAQQQSTTPSIYDQQIIADQQAAMNPFAEAAPLAHAHDPFAPAPAHAVPSQHAAPAPALDPIQQQLAQQPVQHHQPAPTASDLLAKMLLQTATAQHQQATAPDAPHPPAATQAAPHQPVMHQAAQTPQPHHPVPPTPAAPELIAPQTPPEQTASPRGIVGRAMQYANDMVQKLANYFEAKLPPSVITEVKSIGQAMAQHGVKEVPIPQDPSMRSPELPSRGQEQIQQRG